MMFMKILDFAGWFRFDRDEISVSSSASSLYQSRKVNILLLKVFIKLKKIKEIENLELLSGYRTGFGQTLAMPGSDIEYIKK